MDASPKSATCKQTATRTKSTAAPRQRVNLLQQARTEPPLLALTKLGLSTESGRAPPTPTDSVEATRQRLLHCLFLAHSKEQGTAAGAESPSKQLHTLFKERSSDALASGRGGRRNREVFMIAVLAADASVARALVKAGVASLLCRGLVPGAAGGAVSGAAEGAHSGLSLAEQQWAMVAIAELAGHEGSARRVVRSGALEAVRACLEASWAEGEAERSKQAGLKYAAAAALANLCCHRSCAEAVLQAEMLGSLLPLLQPCRGSLTVPSAAWMLGGGKSVLERASLGGGAARALLNFACVGPMALAQVRSSTACASLAALGSGTESHNLEQICSRARCYVMTPQEPSPHEEPRPSRPSQQPQEPSESSKAEEGVEVVEVVEVEPPPRAEPDEAVAPREVGPRSREVGPRSRQTAQGRTVRAQGRAAAAKAAAADLEGSEEEGGGARIGDERAGEQARHSTAGAKTARATQPAKRKRSMAKGGSSGSRGGSKARGGVAAAVEKPRRKAAEARGGKAAAREVAFERILSRRVRAVRRPPAACPRPARCAPHSAPAAPPRRVPPLRALLHTARPASPRPTSPRPSLCHACRALCPGEARVPMHTHIYIPGEARVPDQVAGLARRCSHLGARAAHPRPRYCGGL